MNRFTGYARCLGLVAFALTLIGCCADPPGQALPEMRGLSDQQILNVLAKRADQVQRVMSSGTMQLQSDESGPVRLDVALLAEGNDRLRLRAWKLGRAVFDLTRDGNDVWVWASERVNDPDNADALADLPNAEQLDLVWQLVCGQLLSNSPDHIQTGDPLAATYTLQTQPNAPPVSAEFLINRPDQTIKQITVRDAQGQSRASYTPSRYRLIGGLPWATRIALKSEGFAFEIELDEVELNGTLPKSAFNPPRDARKQP